MWCASSLEHARKERRQRVGKDARVACQPEDAESRERVDAFVIAKIDERSARGRFVASPAARPRARSGRSSLQNSPVPVFLVALQLERLAHLRIALGFRKPPSIDPASTSTSSAIVQIGIARSRASERSSRCGHGQSLRIVGAMRVHERAAKELFVFVRADIHGRFLRLRAARIAGGQPPSAVEALQSHAARPHPFR